MKRLNRGPMLSIIVLFLLCLFQAHEIDQEFETVAIGSILKLVHKSSGYRLHSHEVTYPSQNGASGQQSVTANPASTDVNSFFIVCGPLDKHPSRGTKVNCGDVIRLEHLKTGMLLHSHLHTSLLSRNQEVSAFDGMDSGDNWIVECVDSMKTLLREKSFRLQHVDTKKYLTASTKYKFEQHPIPGQLEIYCHTSKSNDNIWSAQEGFYFASK